MGLIKIHIAFSILCLITFYGFAHAFKEQIKENGWFSEKKDKKISFLLFFFVPILNAILVLVIFLMICVKEKDFKDFGDYVKKESEE